MDFSPSAKSYALIFGAPGFWMDWAKTWTSASAADATPQSLVYSDFMSINAEKVVETKRCITATLNVNIPIPGSSLTIPAVVNIGGGVQMLDANGSVVNTPGLGLNPVALGALAKSSRLYCTGDWSP